MLLRTSDTIDALLEAHVIAPHVAPGACAAACIRRPWGWHVEVGRAGQHAPDEPAAVSLDDWFDLASLTKPLTAYCLARRIDRGQLGPGTRLADCLGWTAATPAAGVTLDALLSHRAGLAAHVELFAPLRDGTRFDRDDALMIAATSKRHGSDDAASTTHHGTPLYSDLGFILLGEALRTSAGVELDELMASELTQLGVSGIGSSRQLKLANSPRAIPTETVPWRNGRLRGVVHDENAFALSGLGCSGHAGAFGRIVDVAGFACAMLDFVARRSNCLSPLATQLLVAPRSGGSMRGGFDGKAPTGSSAGNVLSAASFGHLGFTGTSLWCDPERDLAVVLLTNRVCPSRDNIAIRGVRPHIHDALARHAMLLAHA